MVAAMHGHFEEWFLLINQFMMAWPFEEWFLMINQFMMAWPL
jgi:hypothetical protein